MKNVQYKDAFYQLKKKLWSHSSPGYKPRVTNKKKGRNVGKGPIGRNNRWQKREEVKRWGRSKQKLDKVVWEHILLIKN